MSDDYCRCSGAWFEVPCGACQLREARARVAAADQPRPETEVERLRRENRELREQLRKAVK